MERTLEEVRKSVRSIRLNEHELDRIAQAIFIINKKAKGIENIEIRLNLYGLKNKVLVKLIREGYAKEVGLQDSIGGGINKTRCDVLIQVGNYGFHRLADKEDYKTLPYIGKREEGYRNPKVYIHINEAKKIINNYLYNNRGENSDYNENSSSQYNNVTITNKEIMPRRKRKVSNTWNTEYDHNLDSYNT